MPETKTPQRFDFIRNIIAKVETIDELEKIYSALCRTIGTDEFYTDSQIAAGLRLATKMHQEKLEELRGNRAND
jgi:hypothetical protein